MADHRVTDLDVRDAGADLLHPAGVLVLQSVWQQRTVRVMDRLPLALDHVDVGATQPRGSDAHDHVERAFDLWLFYLLYLQAVCGDALIVPVQPRRLHTVASSLSGLSPTPRVPP